MESSRSAAARFSWLLAAAAGAFLGGVCIAAELEPPECVHEDPNNTASAVVPGPSGPQYCRCHHGPNGYRNFVPVLERDGRIWMKSMIQKDVEPALEAFRKAQAAAQAKLDGEQKKADLARIRTDAMRELSQRKVPRKPLKLPASNAVQWNGG